MSSTRKRKSFVIPPETPSTSSFLLNDDARETEERRNFRRDKSNETPHSRSDAGTGSVISVGRAKLAKMTASERIEHTEKCIQLSAANKISAKNAFSLLLIDQMVELVKKEEANFQVASTHLDASAKIYAARVDKVHADALRFAGDLGTKKPRSAVQDGDDDDDDEGGTEPTVGADGTVAPVKPKKKRRARTVIQKDPKALKSTAHLRSVNISDLYLQQLVTSQEASEPGNCHFLLTLPTSGDHYKMQLRGDDLAYPPVCAELPSECASHVPNFRACLSLPLLPAEIHEMLVEGDAERTQNRITPFDLPPDADEDLDDLPAADFGVNDFADDGDDDDGGGDEPVWTEEVVSGGRHASGDGRDNIATLQESGSQVASSQTSGRYLSTWDYMNLNRAALGLSMGPRDFRQPRPKPSMVIRPTVQKRIKNRAATEVDFTFRPDLLAGYGLPSSSVALSENTVVGWRRTRHLVPELDLERGKRFHNFLMRARSAPLSAYDVERQATKGSTVDGDSHVVDLDASFSKFRFEADHDGDHDMDHDDDHDIDDHDLDEAGTLNALAAGGAPLAPEPQPLNYAKRAKGIDMRMLKKCTWDLVRYHLSDKENADAAGEIAFSQIYEQLPAKLSSKMATNLSPALAFMSVLHLANEHSLSLRNTPDLTELYVSKCKSIVE